MKTKPTDVAQLLAVAFDEADELPPFFDEVSDAVYRLESRPRPGTGNDCRPTSLTTGEDLQNQVGRRSWARELKPATDCRPPL